MIASLFSLAPPAYAVQISVDSLPPARLVEEDRSTLASQGCIERPVTEGPLIDAPSGKPYRVVARDYLPNTLFFCDPQVTTQLTITQGQVEGLMDVVCGAIGGIAGIIGCQTGKYAINKVGAAAGETVGEWIMEAIEGLALVIGGLGLWVLTRGLELVQWSLGANQFITNPLVVAGWPFIQGLANMGFLVALLLIAFATTLGIDNLGARRMLPRLLAAAILINFSLVISGVIIDLTKVLMAIMASTLGDSFDATTGYLQAGSRLIKIATQPFDIEGLGPASVNAITAIARACLVWILAIAVIWLAIGLIMRYVILVFLLIISPLAYLAFAFPNAGNLATRWWQQFFKYVFYGPVALFFLLIAAQLNKLGSSVLPGGGSNILQDLLMWALMVAMIFAAATFSKQVGGTVGITAVNFFNNRAKRVGRTGIRMGTYTLGGAAKLADKEIGRRTGYGVERGISSARDFLDQRKKAQERTKTQQKRESFGTRLGKEYYQTPATRQQTERARAATPTLLSSANNPALWDRTIINPTNLRKSNVTEAIGTDNLLATVLRHTDDKNDVQALIQNPDFVKGMNQGQQNTFVNHIRNNTNIQAVPDLDPARRATMSPQEIRQYELRKEEKGRETRERLITSSLEAFRKADEDKPST